MVYRPNYLQTLTFAHAWAKKVVKCASSEMQGRVLLFKGRFDWFETISADSRPQNVKNVL